MGNNTFGNIFQFHSFGESHGPALGVILEGCPAGLIFDSTLLQKNLDRRKPGQLGIQSVATSARAEADQVEILSGVFEGKTLGTPIAMMVRNHDARSADYEQIKATARAGHADDVWVNKFGHSDPRGGGRSSGRETISRVMAGSVAEMLCKQLVPELKVQGFVRTIGKFSLDESEIQAARNLNIDQFVARFPSSKLAIEVTDALANAKQAGDSFGGIVHVRIENCPAGLGQPVFHKLKSDLAMAILSIGAFVSFDLGDLSNDVAKAGSEFHSDSQNYGGIRGGISTGEEINFSAAIKPTSSILDVAKKGRHDPFIGTRAVPVAESMVWCVLADHLLMQRLDRWK